MDKTIETNNIDEFKAGFNTADKNECTRLFLHLMYFHNNDSHLEFIKTIWDSQVIPNSMFVIAQFLSRNNVESVRYLITNGYPVQPKDIPSISRTEDPQLLQLAL